MKSPCWDYRLALLSSCKQWKLLVTLLLVITMEVTRNEQHTAISWIHLCYAFMEIKEQCFCVASNESNDQSLVLWPIVGLAVLSFSGVDKAIIHCVLQRLSNKTDNWCSLSLDTDRSSVGIREYSSVWIFTSKTWVQYGKTEEQAHLLMYFIWSVLYDSIIRRRKYSFKQ